MASRAIDTKGAVTARTATTGLLLGHEVRMAFLNPDGTPNFHLRSLHCNGQRLHLQSLW
jgi:hypothetical protein